MSFDSQIQVGDLGVSLHSHDQLPSFLDAATTRSEKREELIFDARYLKAGFEPAQYDSPIIGVNRTIPVFVEPDVVADFVPFTGSLGEYAEQAKTRLLAHLRDHWDASRPTLVSHSSGYDSRILSCCLVELREDGFDLGELHFRCHDPEGPGFLELMRRQGWHPSQYSVFAGPVADPLDVGRWDDPGTSPWLSITHQLNYWRDIVPYDEEREWQLLTGSGGGECFEYPSQPKPPSVDWRLCPNSPVQRWLSYFIDGTDVLADYAARFHRVLSPYFGTRHIQTVAELPDRFLGFDESGCDHVRAAILRTFADSTLDIPRTVRFYTWNVSPQRWTRMRDQYAASRFLREVPGAPDPDVLISRIQATLCSRDPAERIWRLAALWEAVPS